MQHSVALAILNKQFASSEESQLFAAGEIMDSQNLGGGAPSAWAEALALMQRALAMLDQSHCAADIGAHLDLAASRLEEHMLRFGPVVSEEPALIVEPI